MNKGTVKFFNDEKGFGFITGENGEDIFVHVSGLKNSVQVGDQVTYDVEKGKRGLNAINVAVV